VRESEQLDILSFIVPINFIVFVCLCAVAVELRTTRAQRRFQTCAGKAEKFIEYLQEERRRWAVWKPTAEVDVTLRLIEFSRSPSTRVEEAPSEEHQPASERSGLDARPGGGRTTATSTSSASWRT